MLEQWEADHLLALPKVYSDSVVVDLSAGTDLDYPIESADGHEFFLLDVRRAVRSKKTRIQLRYRREIILARLCTSVPHTNPDGSEIGLSHYHRYREGYGDKWAAGLDLIVNPVYAVEVFCGKINLPIPDIQGGLG